MHAREQELSNALAETSTFAMHHLQVSFPTSHVRRLWLHALVNVSEKSNAILSPSAGLTDLTSQTWLKLDGIIVT